MNRLVQFLGSPVARNLLHALGWTLLHLLWQGAIVAALLWCALQLLATRLSQARYAAACTALVLLVAVPLITFGHLAANAVRSGQITWDASTAIDPSMMLQVNATEIVALWPARVAAALDHRMPWLLALWFAGTMFFVARLNYGLLVANRLKSVGTGTPTAALLELFDEMKHRLGIARAVRLLDSVSVQVPTVIGWLRPVVLLPANCLTGLSTAQIEAIFCHELAHVLRHDYLVSVMQSVAEALIFYHPAVWWISQQIRRERECCCDQIAIDNVGDVLAYAKALSYLEEHRAAYPEFVLGANGGVLSMRIRRLLGPNPNAPASQFAALTLLVLMISAAGSYVATIAHAAQPKPQPAVGFMVQSPSPSAILLAPLHAIGLAQQQSEAIRKQNPTPRGGVYSAWLDQDVVYLITPEERAAFLNLASDQDRDEFIEKFWERREPPGSPAGTFKAEHYARIAYANQHFAAAGKPGWTTDRARTYIVLGKPYSIESHPSGTADSSPFEIWHYTTTGSQKNDVYMRFVDTAGDGNYRLVSTIPISQNAAAQNISQNAAWLLEQDLKTRAPEDHAPAPKQNDVATEYNGVPLRKIGGGVTPPMVIFQASPDFGSLAEQAKGKGPVIVALIVDENGLPQNIHVVRGAGTELDEKAVQAIQQYKFKPAMENGEPIPVALNIEVNFRVTDKTPASQAAADTAPTIRVNPRPPAANPTSAAQDSDLAIRKIGGTVSAPILIFSMEPDYSPEAKAAKTEGVVLVNLVVDAQGTPQSIRIIRGLPNGLNQSAIDAVRQYHFRPAMENGKPVPVELNIEVNFKLF